MESLDEPPDRQVSPALLRDWREIPSEVLESQEIRHLLQWAVGELPQIYREIFLLRDVEELSVVEAAEVLQITTGSVKVRLHRARTMLQHSLAPKLKLMNPQGNARRGGSRGHRMQTCRGHISGYLDGTLDAEVLAQVQNHLEHCEICSAILDSTRNILILIADDRVYELPLGFSERLHARLDEELSGLVRTVQPST